MVIIAGDESFKQYEDLIVVPTIRIGATEVGPVCFANRDRINFEIMSDRFMDAPIDGALGANFFSLLSTIVIDYPSGNLRFP